MVLLHLLDDVGHILSHQHLDLGGVPADAPSDVDIVNDNQEVGQECSYSSLMLPEDG